jgi:hypothetical protein
VIRWHKTNCQPQDALRQHIRPLSGSGLLV